jgi:hypothetical protein
MGEPETDRAGGFGAIRGCARYGLGRDCDSGSHGRHSHVFFQHARVGLVTSIPAGSIGMAHASVARGVSEGGWRLPPPAAGG